MAVTEDRPKLTGVEVWHEVAAAGLILMELSWLAFFFGLIYDLSVFEMPPEQAYLTDSFWRAALVLGAMFAGGYLMARLFHVLDVKVGVRRGVFIAFLAISVLAGMGLLIHAPTGLPGSPFSRLFAHFTAWNGIPPEFWVLVVILLVWRRAAGLASQPVDLQTVLISFQVGLLTLMLSELFPPRVNAAVGFHPIYLFLFLGLFSMGAARIADTNGLRGAKIAAFDRKWLVAVAAGALLVVAVGAGLAGLLNGWLGRQLGYLLLIAMSILGGLVLVIVWPLISLLAKALLYFRDRLFNLPADSLLAQFGKSIQKWADQQGQAGVETLEHYGKPVAMIGLLVMLVLGTIMAIRWYTRMASSASEKGRSTLTAQELLKDLADAARRRAQAALDELARRLNLRQAAGLIRAARIRWVYRQLMELCDDLGTPRPAAATPLEFVGKLESVFPSAPRSLREITGAYLKVRYGELPESDEDVQRVLSAWEEVNGLGQQELSARKKNARLR